MSWVAAWHLISSVKIWKDGCSFIVIDTFFVCLFCSILVHSKWFWNNYNKSLLSVVQPGCHGSSGLVKLKTCCGVRNQLTDDLPPPLTEKNRNVLCNVPLAPTNMFLLHAGHCNVTIPGILRTDVRACLKSRHNKRLFSAVGWSQQRAHTWGLTVIETLMLISALWTSLQRST